MINCPYFTPRTKDTGDCSIGLYGGKKISSGTCLKCIKLAQNTLEHAKAMEAIYEKAWPSGKARISGCCDRSDQA